MKLYFVTLMLLITTSSFANTIKLTDKSLVGHTIKAQSGHTFEFSSEKLVNANIITADGDLKCTGTYDVKFYDLKEVNVKLLFKSCSGSKTEETIKVIEILVTKRLPLLVSTRDGGNDFESGALTVLWSNNVYSGDYEAYQIYKSKQ